MVGKSTNRYSHTCFHFTDMSNACCKPWRDLHTYCRIRVYIIIRACARAYLYVQRHGRVAVPGQLPAPGGELRPSVVIATITPRAAPELQLLYKCIHCAPGVIVGDRSNYPAHCTRDAATIYIYTLRARGNCWGNCCLLEIKKIKLLN